MNILVIEDSRFLRTIVARTLTRAGYAVTAVADGEQGVLAARTDNPSLILLDMMLPGLDGTSVLKALKQDTLTARIPVIVMTGLSQRNEAKLRSAGAAAYIEKTLLKLDESADALIPVIESIIGKTSQNHSAAGNRCSQLKTNVDKGQAELGDKESLR
jgi:DNA-binding response OmpR family regulator